MSGDASQSDDTLQTSNSSASVADKAKLAVWRSKRGILTLHTLMSVSCNNSVSAILYIVWFIQD